VSHLRFDSSSFAVSNLAFVNVPEPIRIKLRTRANITTESTENTERAARTLVH